MKVLLIDEQRQFLDLALLAQNAGHEVRMYFPHDASSGECVIARGLCKLVSEWEPSMNWADLIILSGATKVVRFLEKYRKKGYPIFGSNVAVGEWEDNRGLGQEVLKKAGIRTMDSVQFKTINEAKAFLIANPGRFVSKPDHDGDKEMSYVSKGRRDMMAMLDRWQKDCKLKNGFLFQKFVPGVEVAVGGWFGRAGFSQWFFENFEFKKLFAGELGPNTGEVGTVGRYTRTSLLAEKLLRPLEGELFRQGFTGYIDVATIVGRDGVPYPLEFTCRPGDPTDKIRHAVHKGDPVEWMMNLLKGEDTLSVSTEVVLGVTVFIPDFPFNTRPEKTKIGHPIWGHQKIPIKHFHPSEVMRGDIWEERDGKLLVEDGFVTAGSNVCTITGCGNSVQEAKAKAYHFVDHIQISNSPAYRVDIGDRLRVDLRVLKSHGYCHGLPW